MPHDVGQGPRQGLLNGRQAARTARQGLLPCWRFGLMLPAVIRAAAIGDRKLVTLTGQFHGGIIRAGVIRAGAVRAGVYPRFCARSASRASPYTVARALRITRLTS